MAFGNDENRVYLVDIATGRELNIFRGITAVREGTLHFAKVVFFA